MTQTELKFERFGRKEQLDALDALQLPSLGGVSGATLKAVLRSIESHARGEGLCWATQETIQREIGRKNVRTVKRAVAALQEANLIACERVVLGFGRWVNHHAINWQQVRDLLAGRAAIKPENVTSIGDKMSPALVTFSADLGDKMSPALVTNSHLPIEKRNSKRKEPPPPNETAAAEFYNQEQEAETMPRAPKRKQPEPRPILEADYEAAPTQHRLPTVPPTPSAQRPTTIQPGSPEDLAAVRDYQSRRRTVRSWSGDDQDRVRDMFAARRVAAADEVVKTAIMRGLSPEDCDNIVEQFEGSVDAKTKEPLGPGAIKWRVENGTWPCLLIAKVDLAKLGPSIDPAKVAAGGTVDLATERKHAAQRARFEAEERAAAEDASRRQERETRIGRQLDTLPEPQLLALQERLPSWCRQFFAADLRARPVSGVIARQECFNLLESEGTDGR
jgi:hypothetical protein